jgi:hypothetical protein
VDLVNNLYAWTNGILFWGVLLLALWALGDCLARKAAAFPAVNKLTKPAWLIILVICALANGWTLLIDHTWQGGYPSIFTLVTVVAMCVYLADVRPAVREITGNR